MTICYTGILLSEGDCGACGYVGSVWSKCINKTIVGDDKFHIQKLAASGNYYFSLWQKCLNFST